MEHGGRCQQTQTRWVRGTLRLLSVTFDAAVIGFSAYFYSKWTIGPLLMLGPPAVVGILWSAVDLACLLGRGVHPVACLIMDTLLFLALAALSGVMAFTLAKWDDSGYYFAYFNNGQGGEEVLRIVLGFGILATYVRLVLTMLTFSAVHLAVVGVACVQRHRWDGEARGQRRPVYMVPLQGDRVENPPPYKA